MDKSAKNFFQNGVNEIMEQMKKGFMEMNQKFEEVNKKFEEVNQRLDEHDRKFEEIQRALIVIEDKVANEIPALFDGYNANNEHYEMLEKRVSELEEKENLNSVKISILEDKVG